MLTFSEWLLVEKHQLLFYHALGEKKETPYNMGKKCKEAKSSNIFKKFGAACLKVVACKFTVLTLPDLLLRGWDPYNSAS